MGQVVLKFGSLKIDNGGDTGLSFDAIYHHTRCKKLTRLSSLYIVIRKHRCISTVINFETTKFGHKLLDDPNLTNIYFNCVSYLI